MTTAAMVFGMLPLATGHTEGGEIRMSMGIVLIGGLLSSLFLTLFLVPAMYVTANHAERLVRAAPARAARAPRGNDARAAGAAAARAGRSDGRLAVGSLRNR